MNESQLSNVKKNAAHIRYNIVKMIGPNKKGHYGGSMSCTDIVATLYFYKMNFDPKNPKDPGRDRFILSKGHAVYTQYSALSILGLIPEDVLFTAKEVGSPIQGHPDMRKITSLECNTGSLGQGISQAAGMAAGIKRDGLDAKVYVLLGDAEMAEGQVWEAAMAAYNFKLDNFVVILDKNGLGSAGFLKDRFDFGDVAAKWAAFGFNVYEVDGHDCQQIADALDKTDERNGKPSIIIANTVKGKGIPFGENVVSFHNGSMTSEQYDEVLATLKAQMD